MVRSLILFLAGFLLGLRDGKRDASASRIIFTAVMPDGTTFHGVTMLVLTDSQACTLQIQPVSKAGNPAPVDGVPVWTVSNPDVLDIEVEADGMSATIYAKGPVGTSQVNVVVDADLGEGVRNITGVLDVEIKGGEAVSLAVSAGVPFEK